MCCSIKLVSNFYIKEKYVKNYLIFINVVAGYKLEAFVI